LSEFVGSYIPLDHRRSRHRRHGEAAATTNSLSAKGKTGTASTLTAGPSLGRGTASVARFPKWNTFYFGAVPVFVRFSCLAGKSVVLQRLRATSLVPGNSNEIIRE
jgi:hypothetical protein